MAESLEFAQEREAEGLDFQRWISAFRRRGIHFFVAVLVGWLLVWGASWVIPAKYTSTTTILLERPNMPKDYVAPNIGEDLQSRMQSVEEQILNRTRLLGIIQKYHLYGGGGPSQADAQVQQMRKDIDVNLVHGEQDQKNVFGFAVAYTAHTPQLAQEITAELTDLFIDENVKSQQQASQDTTDFLQSQLEAASASMAEQEQRVRDYEAKHVGELPSQAQSNIQILNSLQTQLQSEQDTLNNAKQQEVYDKELISQINGTDNPAGAVETSADVAAINAQLEQMRAKLTDLSSHYTDRYPDVQNLKRQIARTEKTRDEMIANAKANPGSATPAKAGTQNQALMQAQSQLSALEAEVINRQHSVDGLKAKVALYQDRLSAEPVREQELADLTRGYDQLKTNYDSLLKKKDDSAMATSMEQMQEGERFRIIDPPGLPTNPSSPNRLKLCGAGLGAGIMLGLVVVLGLEFKEGRLYSENELKAQLPMAILAEIPRIEVAADARTRRKHRTIGWATAISVVLIIAAGSAFTFLHG